METILEKPDFTNPEKTLQILTSDNIDYSELTDFANSLLEKIANPHTNQDNKKFHSITQGILECYKRIRNFKSNQWISETKLKNELKAGEEIISFTRVNAKGESCLYKIANFDQIDFEKEIEYADEYEIVNTKPSSNNIITESNNDSTLFKVLSYIQKGENIFLTGFAGTGKSYILNKLKEIYKKKLTITSTTGIAAVNVKGQTIHSWAGVGLCKSPLHKTIDKIKGRPSTLRQILNCKILAIDEISMLNIEAFEYINEVLKEIRRSDKPFGGIQVIFIGDFFQLPPVVNDETDNALGLEIERKYCFDSPVWEEFNLKNIVLKKNYRQNEENFINCLSRMRINKLTQDDIKLLKGRECYDDTYQTDMLHIFSTNDEANRYNQAKFNMIEEPIKLLIAEDYIMRGNKGVLANENLTESEKYILEIFSKNCRAERDIPLKLGAKVMLLVNMDFNKGLINGACGTIQEFNESSILIKFDNGVTSSIPRHTFEYYYNDKVVAKRIQFPLKLAYGITIHKSQGMTLDKLVVDCSRIFEKGQAYVAMSRVKTLNGLYLKNFTEQRVMVDSKVAEFYEKLEEAPDSFLKELPRIEASQVQNTPQLSDSEAKEIIIKCVSEFSGQYGKSGFVKILTGSSAIKDSEYNTKIVTSKYLGILKGRSQKSVGELIEELIQNKVLGIKKISFGRPVLIKG